MLDIYIANDVTSHPSGRFTSKVLFILRKGKLFLPCIENVNTLWITNENKNKNKNENENGRKEGEAGYVHTGSFSNIEAVPSPIGRNHHTLLGQDE